jgi:hypothetical protein
MQHPHPLTQITFTPCPQHERTDPMCAPRWAHVHSQSCLWTRSSRADGASCGLRTARTAPIFKLQASIPEHLMLSQYAPIFWRFLTCPYASTTCSRSWWSNITSANIGRRANITRGGRPRVESLGPVTPQSVFVSCEHTHAFK